MANHHFGEIGDVWKHLALAEILGIEKPLAYWETHSGAASYAMDNAWQRAYGIGRFLEAGAKVPALSKSRYFKLTKASMAEGRYPGSATLAMKILGRKVRDYLFCDTDANSIASLQDASSAMNLSGRTRTFTADGIVMAMRFARNSKWIEPTDTLVFIDPFHAFAKSPGIDMSAVDLARELAERGYKVVYWYGFDQTESNLDRAGWAWDVLARELETQDVSMWCGEIALRAAKDGPIEANPGVRGGCGIFCANLTPESYDAAGRLGEALARIYEDAVLPSGESGALDFAMYGD